MKKNKIPPELIRKLIEKYPRSSIYWKINKKVNDCVVNRRIAAFLVAKDLKINHAKFLTEEDRREIRKSIEFSQSTKDSPPRIIEKEVIKSLEPLKDIVPIEHFLPSKLLEEAAEMAEKAYPLLYIFENSIRNVIKILMENKYGKNWWDLRVKQKHIKIDGSIEDRINEEKQNRWHSSKRGVHKIFYTDLDDLRKIIDTDWPIFKKIHNRKSWLIEHIMQLKYSRNIIAHNNPLKKRDIMSIKTKILEWFDQIKDLKIS